MAPKPSKKQEKQVEKATEAELNRFDFNLATRPDVADRFFNQVKNILTETRNNRRSLEEQWVEDVRDWSCVLDDEGYRGRSNIFVPELNNQVESSVERGLGGVFTGPDYIYAVPMKGTDQAKADKIKAAVVYELEDRNGLFLKEDEHQRQKILLGTSIFKCGFRKETVEIFTRNSEGKPIKAIVPKWHGTRWDVVDLFRWYIYPETADIKEAVLTFEDQLMDIEAAKRTDEYVGLDDVQPIQMDMNHQWVDVERYSIANLASSIRQRPGSALFTEIWTDFEVRKGLIVPVVGVIANGYKVVKLKRNPFWFQTAPYVGSRYLRRPGKIYYGLSLPDRIRTQGKAMNDLMNQSMDSLTFALNPMAIIDPALAGDVSTFKVAPGAKWLGSPEGIKFQTIPDVSQSGWTGMNEVRGQIAQFSDSTPGIAPQLQGKSRSATQASIVQGSVSQRQKVQSKGEETEVLAPMCMMTHSLLQQFMDKEWQIKIQGPDNGEWIVLPMSPGDLVGEVDWVWKGSSAEERTAVRSQQLLAFYNAALQTAAILPPGELDVGALFRRVAKEAFNLHDMDEIFKSMRDKKTVDPRSENVGLMDLQDVSTNPGDDDEAHMKIHQSIIDDSDSTPEQKLNAARHNEKHQVQKKGKEALVQIQARLQALQMVQQGPGGGASGPGGAPQGGPQGPDGRQMPQPPGIGEGNHAQAMTSPAQIMSTARGVQGQ
jgi:hypothetical protein